jgi:hypothetical protein
MTDRDKLPVTATRNVVVQTEQSGSLVARGLEAVRNRQELRPVASKKVAELLKEAEQGNQDAIYELGFVYRDGDDVPQDYVKAYMWFTLELHEVFSTDGRGRTFFNPSSNELRSEIRKFMTPAQMREARRLVREWIKSHAS